MSKKRKNAGAGYGYMFHGAFKEKKDAVAKERKTKGAWIKGVYTPQGHRYVVMSPRTNPIKRKKKAAPEKNPTELLVMAANPHEREQEITLPPNTTITIRTNPEPALRSNWMGAERARIAAGQRARSSQAFDRQAKARRKATRAGEAAADTFYGEMRKRSRSGGREKRKLAGLFHEVFGENPAPVCGYMIGGYPCSRRPGHKGPHLPQGATMRPVSRLRSAWIPKRKQRNPSAAAIRESFTGQETDAITMHDEPCMPAGDYAQIGELLALYVKPIAGGQVQVIKPQSKARPIVLAAESGRQLYFAGGDQDLASSLQVFGARDRGGDVFEIGEARRIDYKQRKEHVPDPELDQWRHEFGEENGIRPIVLWNAKHQRILLEGGDYRIRPEGIVN